MYIGLKVFVILLSLLCVFLIPEPEAIIFFITFFGFYPLIREKIDSDISLLNKFNKVNGDDSGEMLLDSEPQRGARR